jgi:hypothetical protein
VTTPGYFPSYNGTFNADDNLVAPWWVPGWTAQAIGADTVVAGAQNATGPGFPTNLALVQLTGNYFDTNGSGASGFLTVMMSDGITVQDGSQYYRLPQRLTGTMNQRYGFAYNNWGNGPLYLEYGLLNIEVFATDQSVSGSTITTDSGVPLSYWVTEHMLGGRTYQITVPSSDAPGPVDINSLIVPGSVRPFAYDPVNPMGNTLIPVPPPSAQPTAAATAPSGGTFIQAFTDETTVTVNHNLNTYPAVAVVDSSGNVIMANVQYVSTNSLVVSFTSAQSGMVVCNA